MMKADQQPSSVGRKRESLFGSWIGNDGVRRRGRGTVESREVSSG